jgi:hypothetical protein
MAVASFARAVCDGTVRLDLLHAARGADWGPAMLMRPRDDVFESGHDAMVVAPHALAEILRGLGH